MGTCPFCRAQTIAGDSICYSCGRVITGTGGMDSRAKGEYMRGSTRMATKGVAPRFSSAKPKRMRKKKQSRIYQLAMLGLIAFVFLSPDAREFVLSKWAEAQDYAKAGLAPHQVYPLEADYTMVRSIELWNNGSQEGRLLEAIPVPVNVSSNENGPVSFAYEDGTSIEKQQIQTIKSIKLRIDGETIDIPHGAVPQKSRENAYITLLGNEVWWPAKGTGDDLCKHGPCVRVHYTVPPSQYARFDFQVSLSSTTHTWWHSTRMDGKIEGKAEGISVDRSGTFQDVDNRGAGTRGTLFASTLNWYDRNPNGAANWAIDGRIASAPTIAQTAAAIEASLPSNLKNNAYAFARATFDWLNDNVPYDINAPTMARSGEQCLDDGIGDCDEQSNAFMSIMRIKGLPAWYVFGALSDSNFNVWQGHAWAYVMLPLSDEYCEANNIILHTCYVEGVVDVVNHKWLTHTPTAYIDWIEQAPSTNVDGYYSGGSMSSNLARLRSFATQGNAEITGGTWNNKWLEESFI